MEEAVRPPNVIRFGMFEVDLRAANYARKGWKSNCKTSPSKLWPCCWSGWGEVVTREELRQKLWAYGTFVDFDHSLNIAIRDGC